jgi:hypothetical protein
MATLPRRGGFLRQNFALALEQSRFKTFGPSPTCPKTNAKYILVLKKKSCGNINLSEFQIDNSQKGDLNVKIKDRNFY